MMTQELRVPMLASPAVVNPWRFAVTQGLGAEDFTAITRLFERSAGVETRSR